MPEPWHLFLYRLDQSEPVATRPVTVHDRTVPALQLKPGGQQSPFEITFDEARQRLEELAGGYCEGDGAFGWHPPHHEATHLCGTIHCVDERVICVEMHAKMSRAAWSELSQALRIDDDVAVQFPESGIFVTAATLADMLAVGR